VKVHCIYLILGAGFDWSLMVNSILWLTVDSRKWKTVAFMVWQGCSGGRNHSRWILADSWYFP